MKLLNFAVTVQNDGDIELTFVSIGPVSIGLRLDKVPEWLAKWLRPAKL